VLEGLGKSRGTACTYRENTNWYLPAVSRLTALTDLNVRRCPNMTTEVLLGWSGLALTSLDVSYCGDVTTEGLCAVIK
jgi:hypothetical protein